MFYNAKNIKSKSKKNIKNKGFLIFFEWNIDIIGWYFIVMKLNTYDLHYYSV